MEHIKKPRCYKTTGFSKIVEYTFHFSDASKTRYGQDSFLKMINEDGDVHCCLIFGKPIAVPVKNVSILRLDGLLSLSVILSDMLRRELDILFASDEFWTDSQVILGYISNEAWRFKVSVANRIQFTWKSTNVRQWHYVCSQSSPAYGSLEGLD